MVASKAYQVLLPRLLLIEETNSYARIVAQIEEIIAIEKVNFYQPKEFTERNSFPTELIFIARRVVNICKLVSYLVKKRNNKTRI